MIAIEHYLRNYGHRLMKKLISKKVKYSGIELILKKTMKNYFLFSYRPDGTSDPFSESGIIWSFNFFFHNRKLRRILFLTCRADCKISNDDDEDGPVGYTNNNLTFEG